MYRLPSTPRNDLQVWNSPKRMMTQIPVYTRQRQYEPADRSDTATLFGTERNGKLGSCGDAYESTVMQRTQLTGSPVSAASIVLVDLNFY